jgi:hypothetical protein
MKVFKAEPEKDQGDNALAVRHIASCEMKELESERHEEGIEYPGQDGAGNG